MATITFKQPTNRKLTKPPTPHESRKSFRKFGMSGQLTEPVTTKQQVKASAMNEDGAFNIPLLRHINRRHHPIRNNPAAQMASRIIKFGAKSIFSHSQNRFGKFPKGLEKLRPTLRHVLSFVHRKTGTTQYRRLDSGQIIAVAP